MIKKNKIKDIHEFHPLNVEIEDRPINPVGRIVLWLVLGVIVFGVLWVIFAKIDIVVSARGQVIPAGEIKVIQPIERGVVSKIFIKEGDLVKKGQLLMQIDPSITETSLDAKEKNLKVLNHQVGRLEALVNEKKYISQDSSLEAIEQEELYIIQNKAFKEGILQYDMRLSQALLQHESAKSEHLRLKVILDENNKRVQRLEQVLDIIAKKEYYELQKEIAQVNEQINSAMYKIEEVSKKVSELKKEKKAFIEQFKDGKYQELLAVKKELRNLRAEINAIKFQNQKQSIVSPVDGYIAKLMINTIGGVVTPAEKLISIVPKNSPLIVKANVLNQDIGFVKLDMDSKIKIDTFSFQKYGYFQGKVINVGNYSVEDEKLGPIYEIKIEPDGKKIEVEGEQRYLEAGMSVTTEIKVGKRRVIEFFIYPIIQYLDEGMSVR